MPASTGVATGKISYHRIAGPKPQCAGCRNVTFNTGDICVQRTYRFCVELQCFSKLPKFSSLRPITNAVAGDGISQQDFERAYSHGITIE